MSILDYIIIALAIIIPGGIPVYFLWRAGKFGAKKSKIAYEEVSEEYDYTAKKEYNEIKAASLKIKNADSSSLEDAAYLQALLAVMVKKYGVIRLNQLDFEDVTTDDYISLYVDLNTNDIILKSNTSDITSMFTTDEDEDDPIYH